MTRSRPQEEDLVIPITIHQSRSICRGAKLFFGAVARECERSGACYLLVAQLAEEFRVSGQTIRKWIKELTMGGYIDGKREVRGEKPFEVIVDSLLISEKFRSKGEGVVVESKAKKGLKRRAHKPKIRNKIEYITQILEPQ